MGFIQNIVLPLFEEINVFLGSPALDSCVIEQLKENLGHWEQLVRRKRRFTVKSAAKLQSSRSELEVLVEKVRPEKRG